MWGCVCLSVRPFVHASFSCLQTPLCGICNFGLLLFCGSLLPRLSDLIQMKRTEQEETLKRVEEQVHQRFLEKVMKMESKLKAEEREVLVCLVPYASTLHFAGSLFHS